MEGQVLGPVEAASQLQNLFAFAGVSGPGFAVYSEGDGLTFELQTLSERCSVVDHGENVGV